MKKQARDIVAGDKVVLEDGTIVCVLSNTPGAIRIGGMPTRLLSYTNQEFTHALLDEEVTLAP